MIIAQITDTHIQLPGPNAPNSEVRAADLRRAVADINALDTPPDAVIHTGDLTQNARPEEYARAREILDQLQAPLYVTPGNRDSRKEIATAFTDRYEMLDRNGFINYAVDDHPVRLIAFDSLSANSNLGDFCKNRLTALDAKLATHPEKPSLVFMHHPPFEAVAEKNHYHYERLEAAVEIKEVLSRHAQVIRVLSGHAHQFDKAWLGDVEVSTQPSLATELRCGFYPIQMADTVIYQLHFFNGGRELYSQARIVDSHTAAA